MEEKHTCKLCSRRFANGRALGGHMRSHLTSATTKQPPPGGHQFPTSPPSSSSSEPEEKAAYSLRENPRKSFRMVDPEFSDYGSFFFPSSGNSSSMVVQEGESETESTKLPAPPLRRSRSARPPRRPRDQESSISDATNDEDVALCLVMLSRDAWSQRKLTHHHHFDEEEGEELEAEEESYHYCYKEHDHQSEEESDGLTKTGRSRYRCGTCRKVFRSYQALGGHRASHKKVKHAHGEAEEEEEEEAELRRQLKQKKESPSRIHECPFCLRVFPSGQALGGHKRSHLASSAPARAVFPGDGESFIDLNLPPTADDRSALSDSSGD